MTMRESWVESLLPLQENGMTRRSDSSSLPHNLTDKTTFAACHLYVWWIHVVPSIQSYTVARLRILYCRLHGMLNLIPPWTRNSGSQIDAIFTFTNYFLLSSFSYSRNQSLFSPKLTNDETPWSVGAISNNLINYFAVHLATPPKSTALFLLKCNISVDNQELFTVPTFQRRNEEKA